MKAVLITSFIAVLAIPLSASDFASRATRFVEPYVRSNNFSGLILVKRGERVLVRGGWEVGQRSRIRHVPNRNHCLG